MTSVSWFSFSAVINWSPSKQGSIRFQEEDAIGCCSSGVLLAKGSSMEEMRDTLSKGCSFWRGVLLSEIPVPNPKVPGAPVVQIPTHGFCPARNTSASSPWMWPHAGPKLQTNMVFLVPLRLLACRSEHQTCASLHMVTGSPTSGTATSSMFKARLIAKKNLLESPTHPLLFLSL